MGQAIRPARAALVALALAASVRAATPASPSATADFSGGGRSETITARTKGKVVRLEARDDFGKRIARADAPAPDGGRFDVVLSTGSIGSAGTLLEVAASRGETICRSVWRLRDSALSRLPLRTAGGTLPDCDSEGWTSHWDETRNEPARYVRERTRGVSQGTHHETRVFSFAGFDLPLDPKKSSAEINGVSIPEWNAATLYPKLALEGLSARYQLSALSRGPRLRLEADRERGAFDVRLFDGEGEMRLPVTGSKPVERADPGVDLTAAAPGGERVEVLVTLAGGSTPQDASVKGAGRFDGGYASVLHWDERKIELFPTAEQEIATQFLPGAWTTDRNERLLITAGGAPAAVRFGGAVVSLSLDAAPEGTDLLLLPGDGSRPAYALTLRGPNAFRRTAVRCGEANEKPACRTDGEGETFRRIGSQVNVR